MPASTAELERSYALVEAAIGRPLRDAEKAIDVALLDQALERAKDELEEAIRAEMLRAAKRARLGLYPSLRLTPAMLKPLQQLHDLGRDEALAELERLGYTGIRESTGSTGRQFSAPDPEPGRGLPGVEDTLRRGLPGIAIRIEDELVSADLTAASSAALARALLRVPGARDLASRVISTALTSGLGATFEENRELVRCWEYTAVLDAATCEVCQPLDGKRYSSLEELFLDLPNFGPNPRCKGGGRCRCRAVPCPREEVGQNPPPIPDDLPPWRRELEEIRRRDFIDPTQRDAEFLYANPDVARETGEILPGPRLIDDEAAILRAGELVDEQLEARLVERLGSGLEERRRDLEHAIEAGRVQVARADDVYRAALREADAAEQALLESIRVELRSRGGLEPFQTFRAAREDPRYLELVERHKTGLLELQRARDELAQPVLEAKGALKALEADRQQAIRDSLFEILEEVRPMGRGDLDGWAFTTGGRRGEAKQLLDQATEFFPRDWIERGRASPIKAVMRRNGRGYHSAGGSSSEIVVSGGSRSKIATDSDGLAVAIHELGHHIEHVDPRVRLLEWSFYQRRTRTPGYGDQEPEKWLGSGYRRDERYREDLFLERYMGKTYGNRPTSSYELLTMGLESLWTGSYTLDPEMRRFILGLLAIL